MGNHTAQLQAAPGMRGRCIVFWEDVMPETCPALCISAHQSAGKYAVYAPDARFDAYTVRDSDHFYSCICPL